MSGQVIGIIGGSGLYELDGLTDVRSVSMTTPFGDPSDDFITGTLDGVRMVFLPRHGKGHRLLPSEINFRANIYGMKKLGVTHLISVSAVGSMKEEIVPGHIVIPDQFIDRTNASRVNTFFGNGIVAHAQFADPVCSELSDSLYTAAQAAGATVHRGGTYICMEGPAFSTRAESVMYRSFGASIIGMTNVPEAKLAREAEICYGVIALATDYDCWHESHEDVSIDAILEIVRKNVTMAKAIIKNAVGRIGRDRKCSCASAMQYAVITDRAVIPPQTRANLDIIIGKYL
ncbi:methylthioadenosine phosphorylase [Geotalea daltonii FRC-32]|uniref:S-methyl-5'-thioadenosine phosphorylase n=1 Tax=Geotalea daltonii (strain DSM 22248 / JCM 15807 / FRC-32) TaxID=316067 RepID=B9M697_GEODF|nr:S-methyl-5'-thioadenosine phosphorylase [Geotalea daltonii]ACM21885.1 methylthioadenosine phosphorylase [Geotalea daltonii FRC-32]